MAETKIDDPMRKTLENEYSGVMTSSRYFTGIRFAVLAFSVTLISFLVGTYQYVLTADAEKLGALREVTLRGIPLIGMFTTFVLTCIDRRTMRLHYHCCSLRGRAIEEELGVADGYFRKLRTAPAPLRYATHTATISFFYGLMYVVWTYLLVFTLATAA